MATPSPGQRLSVEADTRCSAWARLCWVHYKGVIAHGIIDLWQGKGEGARGVVRLSKTSHSVKLGSL